MLIYFSGDKEFIEYVNKYNSHYFTSNRLFFKMYLLINGEFNVIDCVNKNKIKNVQIFSNAVIRNFPYISEYGVWLSKKQGNGNRFWFLRNLNTEEKYIIEIENGNLFLYKAIIQKEIIKINEENYSDGYEQENISKGDLIFKFLRRRH